MFPNQYPYMNNYGMGQQQGNYGQQVNPNNQYGVYYQPPQYANYHSQWTDPSNWRMGNFQAPQSYGQLQQQYPWLYGNVSPNTANVTSGVGSTLPDSYLQPRYNPNLQVGGGVGQADTFHQLMGDLNAMRNSGGNTTAQTPSTWSMWGDATHPGVAPTAFQMLTSGFNTYLGWQQMKQAKEEFEFNKQAYLTNLHNQAKLTNDDILFRQQQRYFNDPSMFANPDEAWQKDHFIEGDPRSDKK